MASQTESKKENTPTARETKGRLGGWGAGISNVQQWRIAAVRQPCVDRPSTKLENENSMGLGKNYGSRWAFRGRGREPVLKLRIIVRVQIADFRPIAQRMHES